MRPACGQQTCGIESNICMHMLGCLSRIFHVQRQIIMVMVVGILPVQRGLFQLNRPLRNSQWTEHREGLPQNGHQQKNRAQTAGHERRFYLTPSACSELSEHWPNSALQGLIGGRGQFIRNTLV